MAIKVKASTWKNITGAYVKSSTWRPAKQIFVKVVNTWKSVFISDPPVIGTKPSFRLVSYSGTEAGSPQYLDQDLFGKDGSYSNYTSISGRKITYSDSSDGLVRNLLTTGDLFTASGGITTSDRLTVDGKYLFYELTVSNGTDILDSIEAVSNPILMTKKQPALGSFTTAVAGQASPNSVLTFNYSLENYYYNRVEQANSKIRWWRSSGTTASGTLLKEEILTNTVTSSDSTSLIGSSTYTIDAISDNGFYIVVEIIGVSSWTRNNGYGSPFEDYQITKISSGPVSAPYRFQFGNNIYVSSNGHIGLNSGSGSVTSMSSGRNLSIFVKDLTIYSLQEYSNSSVYYLYVKSYLYNTSASSVNALDYQIKFYHDTNINYCDVYIVRKGSSVASLSDVAPGYYESGNSGYAGMAGPYFIGAGTTFRIYFGGSSATTSGISWTAVSDNLWDTIQTWTYPPGGDDIFITVASASNQQAPVLTAPSITSVSSTVEGASVTAYFSGGSGPYYQIYWTSSGPTLPVQSYTPDATGSSSPITDSTGPATTGVTWYMYVRSVSSLNESSVGPSSLASSWSSGYSFTVASANLTPPTITNVTAGNSSGQPVTVYFTGGSGPYYQIWWTLGVGGTGYDEYGYSSPITDNTGPTSAATNWYAYVRSVSALTNVGTGPSTTISAWSTGYQFTVTQAPIIPTITMGSNTNVGTGGATINWSSTNQSYAYVDGTYVGNVNSYTFTGKSSSTNYSGTVTVYSTTGNTASANYSFTTTTASVIPTITMGSNTGVTSTAGTINWTSTNQSSYSSTGTFSGTGTTGTSISQTGLSASTTYTGTVTVTSSTSNTASASYSLTTSAAPAAATFVIGTVSASRTATRQITGTWTSTRSGGTFQWWNTRIRNTASGATATHSLYSETPKSDVYTSLTGTSYRFGVQGVSYDSNYSVYRYTVGSSDTGAYTENSTNINPA